MSKRKTDGFWLDIIQKPDGTLDREAVLNELADYSMVQGNYSEVLCYITEGRISKVNTDVSAIKSIVADVQQAALDALEAEVREDDGELRELFAGLVNQFALQRPDGQMSTASLSDMEAAFIYLGLEDPCSPEEFAAALRPYWSRAIRALGKPAPKPGGEA